MKKLFYTLLAATALIACAKEADFNNTRDNEVINENGLVSYTFHAYFEDQTKASINESGKFSWGAAGTDQIAVWDATHSEFVTFTSTDNNGNFRCEAKPGASFNGQIAYYPASVVSTKSFAFPTSFASLEDAAKGFPMSGTVSADGKIPFAHLGCLIKMTLNNVPSFTTALILNDGTRDITVTTGPTDGVINAVVPIPAGEYVLTAKLKDDNNNIFYSHARSSKTYTKKYYYPTNAINLGTVVQFSGTGVSGINKVKYTQRIGYDRYGSNNYTWDLLTLKDGTKYAILPYGTPSSWEWLEEGTDAVQVDVYNNSTYKASCSYMYVRNLDFDITEGDTTLKTAFRVYPISGSDATVSIRAAINSTKVWVQYWSEANYIHYWGFTSISDTSWGSGPATSFENIGGNYFKSYVFDAKVMGETGSCLFTNNFNSGNSQTGNLNVDFNTYSEIYFTGDSNTNLSFNSSKSIPSIDLGSKDDVAVGSGFFEFPSSRAGQDNVVIKISNKTNTLRAERITLNKDYFYAL